MTLSIDPVLGEVHIDVDELHGGPSVVYFADDQPSSAAACIEAIAQTVERAFGRQEARRHAKVIEDQEKQELIEKQRAGNC